MKKPWQQGHFDGFCGVYSIINSINSLYPSFTEADSEALFTFMARNHADLFSQAILNGIGFKQLWALAKEVQEHLHPMEIELDRPFYNQPSQSSSAFLDRIQDETNVRRCVAIVGLGSPWNHWTVITRVMPKTVQFADSYGIDRLRRSSLDLVERDGITKIDYHQTILVTRS